jgi:transposase
MLVAGVDVGAEVHQVAVVDESEAVVTKPTAFEESAPGYEQLFAPAQSTLVVMEATGHYGQNLFAALAARGVVALVNPLRTHRFAGEELARTKPSSRAI